MILPDLANLLLYFIVTLLWLSSSLPTEAFPTTPTMVSLSSNNGSTTTTTTSRRRRTLFDAGLSSMAATVPDPEIHEEIRKIAEELWDGEEIPILKQQEKEDSTTVGLKNALGGVLEEGEAKLPEGIPYQDRGEYFRNQAIQEGCPKAQHSYGLLLWNGFCSDIPQNAKESAKFHAAAAFQNHLDGIAVLGGCIRTGTGLSRPNVPLGLRLIEYCATNGNPSGINKKAALLESNQNDSAAVKLYEESLKDGRRINALLLFNLGWALVHGQGGVDDQKKDVNRGIDLWKLAASTEMIPDEGSEEAAWHLYQHFEQRDNPMEAKKWRDLAEELGYYE